jgi:hypothetical protein
MKKGSRRSWYHLPKLCVLGIIEEGTALGVEENMKRVEFVSNLERFTLMEEVSWRQKSRIL